MSYKLLILAGALFLQIHQFYRCVQKRGSKLKLLHTILQILPLTPSQLLNKIMESGSSQVISIVKGTVTAAEPTASILESIKNVLYSKLYGAQIMMGLSPKKRLLQTKEPSFLKVADTKTNINLYECHKSIVVPTKKISLSQTNSLFEKFKNKFKRMFSRQSHSNFTNLNYSIFGNDNIEQLFVPDPSQLSILGKFKMEASQLCCYEPIIISPSKQRMAALITEDLARDQIQRVLLVLFLSLTFGLIGKELWSLYQRYKSKNGGNIISSMKKIFIKSRICSICKENLSCILTKQCMHMAVCQTCWATQKQVCNECHGKSKDIVQMYVC